MTDKTYQPGVYVSVEELLSVRHIGKDLSLDRFKKSVALVEGDSRTVFRGRGMEFSEVRPYQPGDDVRNIDWRVTARTQKPYTKLFQEERERPVYIVVDQRSPMFFGSVDCFKSVYAAKLAAIIAWCALTNNDRIGGLIFADNSQTDSRAKRGKHAVMSFIHELHQYNARLTSPSTNDAHISMEEMFSDIRRVAKPGSAIFVLSDFHDFSEECKKPVSLLARHTDITLIQLFDKLEYALPMHKNLAVTNGIDRISISGQSGLFNENYTHSFKTVQNKLKNICASLGIALALLQIDNAVENAANDLFGSGKKVRRG